MTATGVIRDSDWSETGGMDQIAYVAGSLSIFIVLLASLVIVLLLLFVCKGRREVRRGKLLA